MCLDCIALTISNQRDLLNIGLKAAAYQKHVAEPLVHKVVNIEESKEDCAGV